MCRCSATDKIHQRRARFDGGRSLRERTSRARSERQSYVQTLAGRVEGVCKLVLISASKTAVRFRRASQTSLNSLSRARLSPTVSAANERKGKNLRHHECPRRADGSGSRRGLDRADALREKSPAHHR